MNNENNFTEYIKKLWIHQRYYEFINANIIYQNVDNLPATIWTAIDLSLNKTNVIRKLDILDMLDAIIFYSKNNVFSYDCFCRVYNIISNYDWDKFPADESLLYSIKANELELILHNINMTQEFIQSSIGSVAWIAFKYNTNDYDEAYNISINLLKEICKSLHISSEIKLIYAKKGSWIITFAVCGAVALFLPKIAKSYSDVYVEIKTKKLFLKQLQEKMGKNNIKVDDIKVMAEIASTSELVNQVDRNFNNIDFPQLLDSIKIGL